MRHYCRVTTSRMALRHCDEESSRGFARAALLRAARDGASAPFCTTRSATSAGAAGSVTFPSRCLLRSHSRDAFQARVEGRGGARVVPHSLVGDAINVIISIDCSKARRGSEWWRRGERVGTPPIRERAGDDKESDIPWDNRIVCGHCEPQFFRYA